MTEEEIIAKIKENGRLCPTLAYDGTLGGYYCDGIEVEQKIVYNLLDKKLIYEDQVIWGGSVQLYQLTEFIK